MGSHEAYFIASLFSFHLSFVPGSLDTPPLECLDEPSLGSVMYPNILFSGESRHSFQCSVFSNISGNWSNKLTHIKNKSQLGVEEKNILKN